MENQQMGMPQQMAAPALGPDQMAIFDQMRQQISPQEFTGEMLAGASQVDPQAVAEFTQALEGLNMPPEVLDALNDMVDAILAEPEKYAQMRQELIAEGVPEDFLPEQFDPEFFAALNMAVDQMVGAPSGVQAFAEGGIAELKPIAKAIASYGRNGDTMLAHITPAEARMLRRRGGSGTINPHTGLPEFFLKKLFKSIGKQFKAVGKAISKQFKSVVSAVKKFASSTVGKIITTVALGFFLGPAAASMLGVTSSVGVAAVSGFIGSAGSTLAAGGSLKDALKAGAIGGITGGAGAGIMGGADAFASGSYTGATTVGGQFDKFKSAIGLAPAPGAELAPVVDMAPTSVGTNTAMGPGTAPVPDAAAYDPTTATRAVDFGYTPGGEPTAGLKIEPPVAGTDAAAGVKLEPSLFDKTKEFYTKNISPSGIQEAAAPAAREAGNKAVEELLARVPSATPAMQEAAYQTALKAAMPGVVGTYGPMVGAGLGIMALTGGFEQKPVEGGPVTKTLMTPATERMRQEGSQRENYLQNLPGVRYDEFGEPIAGESTQFPAYTSPGFATPSNSLFASGPAQQQQSSTYTPPVGALTNSAGGIYQPYNNSNMYTSLYPGMGPRMGMGPYGGFGAPANSFMPPRRYAAEGGIAALGSGGYPRRTGQISGPGTEKSDSIPAMLSDGEFVMTAKAVRGAGKGSRREGAKRMYKLMHQLEKNSERG
jgi:hypothetical protein